MQEITARALNAIVEECHAKADYVGWWNDLETGECLKDNIHMLMEKLCLVHSEISEAVEGLRKDTMDDHLPHRKTIEVELVDAMIRIADVAGCLKLDLGGAMMEKINYNEHRPDHKIENRRNGGKKA